MHRSERSVHVLDLQVAVMNQMITEKDPFLDGTDLSTNDNVSRFVTEQN